MSEGQARRQVAAGARRAVGERAAGRRRTTPLLADRDPEPAADLVEPAAAEPAAVEPAAVEPASESGVSQPPAETPVEPSAETPVEAPAETPVEVAAPKRQRASRAAATAKRKPAAVPSEPKPSEQNVAEPKPSEQKLPERKAEQKPSGLPATVRRGRPTVRVIPGAGSDPSRASGTESRPRIRAAASRRTPGGERLVAVAAEAGQALDDVAAALAARRGTGGLEQRVASALAFLRRRLTGDYRVDDFGFDPELTDTVLLALIRPLYKHWFRVEVRGIENIPEVGGALVVANHSGAIALDSLMTQVAVHDEHPRHRHLRMLGADLVFSTPVLGEIARKGGATLANNDDAERLLAGGELVGVWPEGFKGIGKPFSERYKLQRFGRGGFVSAALRTETPIVPCAIVGAEETYPIIGDMPAVARLLGLPYAPVTPTFPLLGLLGLIPLPSKWLIEFGSPLPTDGLGHGAADDPMMVFDLTDQVRQTIQQTLYSLLVQRRSVFF